MSEQMSSITGIVLSALNIPDGPRVSPTFMSTPYFFGISISYRHILTPPAKIVHITPSASFSASALSLVAITFAGYFPASTILSTAFLMNAKRSSSMSISAMVQSLSAGNERMSFTSVLVNPKLPAPINAIFFITTPLINFLSPDIYRGFRVLFMLFAF